VRDTRYVGRIDSSALRRVLVSIIKTGMDVKSSKYAVGRNSKRRERVEDGCWANMRFLAR